MAQATINEEQVIAALKDVYDPEIPLNVVDLGLIYGVEISEDNAVHVLLSLTSAGCGMGGFIAQQAEWAVAAIENVSDVSVELTFDPPWTSELITEDGKKTLGID